MRVRACVRWATDSHLLELLVAFQEQDIGGLEIIDVPVAFKLLTHFGSDSRCWNVERVQLSAVRRGETERRAGGRDGANGRISTCAQVKIVCCYVVTCVRACIHFAVQPFCPANKHSGGGSFVHSNIHLHLWGYLYRATIIVSCCCSLACLLVCRPLPARYQDLYNARARECATGHDPDVLVNRANREGIVVTAK